MTTAIGAARANTLGQTCSDNSKTEQKAVALQPSLFFCFIVCGTLTKVC